MSCPRLRLCSLSFSSPFLSVRVLPGVLVFPLFAVHSFAAYVLVFYSAEAATIINDQRLGSELPRQPVPPPRHCVCGALFVTAVAKVVWVGGLIQDMLLNILLGGGGDNNK